MFSDETDHLVTVYLGATISHTPNSHDYYIWTDQPSFSFLADISEMYAHGAEIYKADTGLVNRITFPYENGSGKCVATIYSLPVEFFPYHAMRH